MDILRQFFDKKMWYVLSGLLLAHIVASAVQHTWWSIFPILIAAVAAFVLTSMRMEWGLSLAFLEIFTGGHGHLFDLSSLGLPISLRMAIFGGVMLAWFFLFIRGKLVYTFLSRRDTPWIFFAIAITIGAVNGFLTNDLGNAFDDFNSYLTIFYLLPMITMVWKPEEKRLMILVLTVSAVWVAFSSLFFVFAFTHLPGKFLAELYTFIRDARLAEVTLLSVPGSVNSLFPTGTWYFRIFEQSQFVVLAFELLFMAATFMIYRFKEEKIVWQVWAIHAVMFAVILASFSRSFWLGGVAGGAVLFMSFLLDKIHLNILVKRSIFASIALLAGILILWFLIIAPLPIRPDFKNSPFYKGENGGREVAVSSRWNLLPPMMAEISKSPIIGSGFGEEVTFVTDDPRIRAVNPSGEYTTYRFEWGYQDLWLKMGIFGLVAVFWYLLGVINATILRLRLGDDHRWVAAGCEAGILALIIVHIFSPYLNHPIGLGFMIFVIPFFPWRDEKYEREELHLLQKTREALKTVTAPQIGVVTKE
jgi:hypothetical protein